MRFSKSAHLLLMCLSLEALTCIIRTGQPILVELVDLVNWFIIFPCKMILLTWLPFLLQFLTVTLRVLIFWIYFYPLMLKFVLQCFFLPLGNFNHVVVSVYNDFPLNSQWDVPFHHILYDYSCADWHGLCDHLRDVPWEDIFKLFLLLLMNFESGFRLEIMYISLVIYIRPYLLTHLHGF